MAHLTNFSFELSYEIFTEDASLPFLYHGAKKSKMTKNSNQGRGPCLDPCQIDYMYMYLLESAPPPPGSTFAKKGKRRRQGFNLNLTDGKRR